MVDLSNLSIWFVCVATFHLLKEACYDFSLAYLNCQYHYSYTLGTLLIKIRGTWSINTRVNSRKIKYLYVENWNVVLVNETVMLVLYNSERSHMRKLINFTYEQTFQKPQKKATIWLHNKNFKFGVWLNGRTLWLDCTRPYINPQCYRQKVLGVVVLFSGRGLGLVYVRLSVLQGQQQ